MDKTIINVAIIGSGPAGLTAAIYAARADLKPVLFQGNEPGGQLTITTDVENYPGFAETIQGSWLMEQMLEQAQNVGTNIIYGHIHKVDFSSRPFKIFNAEGKCFEALSVIIATGATAKWLGLKTEENFKGYGVSGCATCDAFFYKNKEVLVIGGGNTAVEEALYLAKFASKVTLIHRKSALRAEKILQNKLFTKDKISIIWDSVLEEVIGDLEPKNVTGAKIRNVHTDSIQELKCDGIFIAIGHAPNTSIFRDQIDMDKDGYIITKPGSTITNIAGVFAAGDVQDKIYRQAVTAAGTGCMAALDAEKFLSNS